MAPQGHIALNKQVEQVTRGVNCCEMFCDFVITQNQLLDKMHSVIL